MNAAVGGKKWITDWNSLRNPNGGSKIVEIVKHVNFNDQKQYKPLHDYFDFVKEQRKNFDNTQKHVNARLKAKFNIEDLYREYPGAKV